MSNTSKKSSQKSSASGSSNRSGGQSQNSSHAVKRRLRLDRIAVVVVPLILIIILITFLCLHSCDRSADESNSTENAVTTTLTGDDVESTDTPSGSATDENTVSVATQVTYPDGGIGVGNLVVINETYAYTFSENEENLLTVHDNQNSSYSVSDWEVRLEAETLDQLNAMMAAYEEETGYQNMEVFSGYRTEEEQQSLYESGSSSFSGGHSDYHSGRTFNLKIKFSDGSSDYYNAEKYPDYSWISENAASYGFVVRYPEDKDTITGEESRSYTFRYVGVPHAVYMTEHHLCLEEYVELLQDYTQDAPLEIMVEDTVYQVFYVSEDEEASTLTLENGESYTVSGDNIGGYILTVVSGETETE